MKALENKMKNFSNLSVDAQIINVISPYYFLENSISELTCFLQLETLRKKLVNPFNNKYSGSIVGKMSSEALERAGQRGAGVPVPGGVKPTWRCGTEGHGLGDIVEMG